MTHGKAPPLKVEYSITKKGLKNIRFYAGFPDHSLDTIKTIIDLGFGEYDEIECLDTEIAPIDYVAAVLRRHGRPNGYKEKECLWLKIYGEYNNKKKTIEMECIAPTLDGWDDAGCNIDTGIPANIIAQMIKNRIIKEKGRFAPEAVVPTDLFFEELAKKQIFVYENGRIINNLKIVAKSRRTHHKKQIEYAR